MLGIRSLPFGKKRQPSFTREQILNAIPLKNPSIEWEKDEQGQVVLTLKRRTDWKTRLLAVFFAVPNKRQIVLDEVGTLVWELCDGATSVKTITEQVRKRYKLNVKEAELSLGQFLKTLTQRGFIGLQVDQPQIQ